MKKFYFALFTIVLLAGSCSKDSKKGCTDSTASNYDAAAEEDCCCTYKGRVLFYFNKATSDRLIANQSNSLLFYIGNTKVGTFSSANFFNGEPICGTDKTMTIEQDLGDSKSKTLDYMIVDEVGRTIWTGKQEWKGGTCTGVELK